MADQFGRYDIAIIGTGPAGISAAITAKVRNKSVILFGNVPVSDKVSKAHAILNYPGLPEIKGSDLAKNYEAHLKALDIEISPVQVLSAYAMGDYYNILTMNNEVVEATTLIVATGVNFGKPYPGEERFLGMGVSYCATCDGNFYRGRTVAVIGSSKKEEEEVKYLADLAAKVYYIPLYKEEAGPLPANVEIIRNKPLFIEGNMSVERLVLKDMELEIDGLFILRESLPPSQLVPGIKLDGNHIEVNRAMETSLPGCFACGDITGSPYQYIKAAGEGNVAALSAVSYLAK